MNTTARVDAQLEILDRPACLDLLASVGVGRVVASLSALPAILPVPIVLDGDDIVFAVPSGHEFERAVAGSVVAIEADLLDRLTGWSVVVTGRAVPVPDDASKPSGPWPPGSRLCRLGTDLVTGRRLANIPIHVGGAVSAAVDAAVNHHEVATRSSGYGPGGESMPVDECLRRLASEEVGRLAAVVDGKPLVFPVNYVLDGDTVVFRTAAGTKLDAITRSPATFEVDRWTPGGPGWTVSVEGFAVEVTDANGARVRDRMAALPLFPWVPGDRSHLVRVLPVSIRGSLWLGRQSRRSGTFGPNGGDRPALIM